MNWFRRLWWRLEILLRKNRVEKELEEELQYHLRRETQENIESGMDPAKARRQARVDFGGLDRTAERVRDERGVRGVEDFVQDIRYSCRKMARNPGFSFSVTLILALGIGATVAMFSILDAALFRSLPFPDSDRLVMGRTTFSGLINPHGSYPDYIDYRDGSDAFEAMAAFRPGGMPQPVASGDRAQMALPGVVSTTFFETLGVEPQIGRGFLPEEGRPGASPVAVISHGFWQRWFGEDPQAVGATLSVAGVAMTVVGVMPSDFHFRDPTDIWVAVRLGDQGTEERGNHAWVMVGRKRPRLTLGQARAQMDVITSQLALEYPSTHENKGLSLSPLGDALAEGYRPTILLLMGAAVLLLIISCGNVAGLLMTRAVTRTTEMSLRTAIGASRRRLVRQLLTEKLLLAAAAGGLGTLLALGIQRGVLALFPLDLLGISEIGLSAPMLGSAMGVSLATVILFGVGPALSATGADAAQELRNSRQASSSSGESRFRTGVVVAQIAFSVVLLSGSGLLVRSLANLQTEDVGIPSEDLYTGNLFIDPLAYPDVSSRAQFFKGVLDNLEAIPGITSASFIDKVPIRHPFSNWEAWNPENPPDPSTGMRTAYARFVLPGYFETIGLPILQGRDVDDREAESSLPTVIINQVMADALYPDLDPIGRRLAVNLAMAEVREFEIIGVVADMRIRSVRRDPTFQMHFNLGSIPPVMRSNRMNLMVRTDGPIDGVMGDVRRMVLEREPGAVFSEVATMESIISRSFSGNRVLTMALSLFALFALFLTLSGLYAILAFHVALRTKEIAIRIAFGAPSGMILRSVARRGLLLVSFGLAGGLSVSLILTRILQAQLYQVQSSDPTTFIVVGGGILVGGVLCGLIPALRAARVDPLGALKAE